QVTILGKRITASAQFAGMLLDRLARILARRDQPIEQLAGEAESRHELYVVSLASAGIGQNDHSFPRCAQTLQAGQRTGIGSVAVMQHTPLINYKTVVLIEQRGQSVAWNRGPVGTVPGWLRKCGHGYKPTGLRS